LESGKACAKKSASSDWSFEGEIIYYYWDFGDGSYGAGPNPTHQYATEGACTVTLTVCDDLWNCASSESYATAGAVNLPARINFDELPNQTNVADQYLSAYGVRFFTDNPAYPVITWNHCGFCSTTSPPNFIEAGSENKGQMIVQFTQPVSNCVSSRVDSGSSLEDRTLSQDERLEREKNEMRKWSTEFAKHAANALGNP
jgi:PKD domain